MSTQQNRSASIEGKGQQFWLRFCASKSCRYPFKRSYKSKGKSKAALSDESKTTLKHHQALLITIYHPNSSMNCHIPLTGKIQQLLSTKGSTSLFGHYTPYMNICVQIKATYGINSMGVSGIIGEMERGPSK